MWVVFNNILYNFYQRVADFLPNLIGGLIILLIGLILANLLKRILISLFSFFKLATVLQRTRLMSEKEVAVWEEVLAEILRWTVIILFLIPVLDVLRLSRASIVLNQFLLYLPNVIIAVVIGFVGLVVSNLVSDIIRSNSANLGSTISKSFAVFTKGVVIFLTIIMVMNQLGVAQDLVRILFTGIVAMVALAGGLAFGLGGKDFAQDVIKELRRNFSEPKLKK